MTSICLAMNVRNEEAVVGRCVRSALPLVDRWVIVDTGSTDGTERAVRDAVGDLPGELLAEPWVDHATNRTRLLAHARATGAEYVLMLDADMEVELTGPLPELVDDEYALTVYDRGLEYGLPLLTRAAVPFFYAGVAHACLNCDGPATSRGVLPEVKLIDHGGGPGKDGKFERDRDALAAHVARHPADTRSWFYLAQTHRDLGDHDAAIECYLHRAEMGGAHEEETYYALYQAGELVCAHRSFLEGAPILLRAFAMRPTRAEALRALAKITDNVADKIARPADLLFVEPGAYRDSRPLAPIVSFPVAVSPQDAIPPRPRITPRRKIRCATRPLSASDVAAVIVTRGNVDLTPILDAIPYTEVVVWNNAERANLKVFGRYAAIPDLTRPVVYWQDDDVIFTEHDALLAAYEPGRLVCNMDDSWIDACGYRDTVGMQGAGSLCDTNVPAKVFARYFRSHPYDDDFLTEADFVFGTLAPFTVVDLGYQVREFADDPDRLYTTPGQPARKRMMIDRCLELARGQAAA